MEVTEDTWQVRQVEDSPTLSLEGFTMHRILDRSLMNNVGCELVNIKCGQTLEPHYHIESHAIILVISGKGYAMLNNVKYPIKKYSVINVPPGVVHSLECSDEELVVYGFQSPGIISENNNTDIYFIKDNRRGVVI